MAKQALTRQAARRPGRAGEEPRGELQIRTATRPADTNQNGDIFGGWVLGQMDVAGGIFASKVAGGRVVTVAIESMTFKKPVYVGDVVCVYAELIRVGRSSITVWIETWVLRRNAGDRILVTEGNFTYVAIDAKGRPHKVKPNR
ncbi:MAG: acyl-CoA thioesterase [Alphaproteobacteria bacterium]